MFYNRALFADSQLDDKEKVESNFLISQCGPLDLSMVMFSV